MRIEKIYLKGKAERYVVLLRRIFSNLVGRYALILDNSLGSKPKYDEKREQKQKKMFLS